MAYPLPAGVSLPLVTMQDVLRAPSVTGMIQASTSGVPDNFSRYGFMEPTDTVPQDVGTYFRVLGTRTTARAVARNSPSVARQMKNVEEVPYKAISVAENLNIPMDKFQHLFSPESSSIADIVLDTRGKQEIGRQVREAKKNLQNLRVMAVASVLAYGAIYFDGYGNLLPSATGARTTVSFQVPSGNTGQLNCSGGVYGGGNILNAGWQDIGTDIASQIIQLKIAAEILTGFPLKHAFYGSAVPKYLTQNTTLSNYFVRSITESDGAPRGAAPANQQYLRTADIPSPLLGLEWHPVYTTFYEDQNGNPQQIFSPGAVVFTPEVDSDWWGWIEGTLLIPGSTIIADGQDSLIDGASQMSGIWGYAKEMDDPFAIKIVYGDTFLPIIKAPKAVFIGQVDTAS